MKKRQTLLALICAGLLSFGAASAQEHRRWLAEKDLDKKDRLRYEYNRDQDAMDLVGLTTGMTVGDLGAGQGYFTFMLAHRVGPWGQVYANDVVDEGNLSIIRERARRKGLDNIVTILGSEEECGFPDGRLDAVFIIFVLHDCTKPVELLRDVARSLRKDGKVVVVDSEHPRLTREHWLDIFSRSGYIVEQTVDRRPLIYQDARQGVIFVLRPA